MIDDSLLNRECVESLKSKIILPAVHLARQLHLSHSRFHVRFSGYNPARPTRDPHILEEFDCIDVFADGKPVKLEDRSQAYPGGSIKHLFDVLPGFYCETFREDTGEEKVLMKPQVLVTVVKFGQGRYQGVTHLGETRTTLASIYFRLQTERGVIMTEGRLRG